jgi:uncharacterized protein
MKFSFVEYITIIMKAKNIFLTIVLFGIYLTSCKNQSNTNSKIQNKETVTSIKVNNMKNLVSIIEIPTSDLKRAIAFYKNILAVNIEEAEMGDVKMGILSSDEGTVNVVLANGADYKPTGSGSVIYLNAGDSLQTILNKVEPNGGKVILPKTDISPEMGFFALFTDTEGNKLGLHSKN